MHNDPIPEPLYGIPDEIVLDHIVPKLPWGALHCLSSVNRRWQHAMQSREIYDARVRSHSTDTLVVINHTVDEGDALSLYSVRYNSWYQLPQLPKPQKSQRASLVSYQCVSLDGKIYALGGVKEYPKGHDGDDNRESDDSGDCCRIEGCSEVYVLDLAGRREWKQCTNMPQPRYTFGCDVVDGKVCLFGGRTSGGKFMSHRDSVAYDPNEDSWSAIMPLQKIEQKMLTQPQQWKLYLWLITMEILFRAKWNTRELYFLPMIFQMFVAKGKLYKITPFAIYGRNSIDILNFETLLHVFGEDLITDMDRVVLIAVVDRRRGHVVRLIQAVNGELLALIWSNARDGQAVLHQSKGIGSENKTISWETVPCCIGKLRFPHFLCSIEL